MPQLRAARSVGASPGRPPELNGTTSRKRTAPAPARTRSSFSSSISSRSCFLRGRSSTRENRAAMQTPSLAPALRRLVIDAQGYAARSARTARRARSRRRSAGLSCVQLDSISAVERSHRIALASRVGAYPRDTVAAAARQRARVRVLGPRGVPAAGRGLAAVPPADGRRRPPLVRRRRADAPAPRARRSSTEIRARGPLASRHFEGERGQGMWNWKPAKAMLDRLWNHGELVIAGPPGLPAPLRPARSACCRRSVLDAPRPGRGRAAARARAARRSHARGALTEAGIVEHWRLRGGDEAHPARGRRPRRRRAARARRRSTTAAHRSLVPAGDRARPAAPTGGGAALAVRQPPLGPAVRPARARLRPPDRGLQAGARAPLRLLRAAVPLAATGSSAEPT